jgi:hypothetical protein
LTGESHSDATDAYASALDPTSTSCLGCADLHRRDRDAAWPAVAAQLRDTVGVADRATLLATAALALSQVNKVIGAVRGSESEPPTSLNATLEFDVHAGRSWCGNGRTIPCVHADSACCQIDAGAGRPSWMMVLWRTSNVRALHATLSWPAFRSASCLGSY